MSNDKAHEPIEEELALHHSSTSPVTRNLIYQRGKGAKCNGAVNSERQLCGVMLRDLARVRLH